MATRKFLQSLKNKDLKFEILAFDAATQTATLQGTYGTFKMVPFTKEKVTADGYTLTQEEAPA